jgi:hypothetical protein
MRNERRIMNGTSKRVEEVTEQFRILFWHSLGVTVLKRTSAGIDCPNM